MSLSVEQSKRWCLEEQLSRHGFYLIGTLPISQEVYPGYAMKRHQNGKAFKTRLGGQLCTFAFTLGANTNAALTANPNTRPSWGCPLSMAVWGHSLHLSAPSPVSMSRTNRASSLTADSNPDPDPDSTSKPMGSQRKRKKMDVLTDGLFSTSPTNPAPDTQPGSSPSATIISGASSSSFSCNACGKCYGTEMNCRAHIYQVKYEHASRL